MQDKIKTLIEKANVFVEISVLVAEQSLNEQVSNNILKARAEFLDVLRDLQKETNATTPRVTKTLLHKKMVIHVEAMHANKNDVALLSANTEALRVLKELFATLDNHSSLGYV